MTSDLGDFIGAAKRLDRIDIPAMAAKIDVEVDVVCAVEEVESAGSGFDLHGRPKMLFEPHLFYRALHDAAQRDRAVSLGLAHSQWRNDYPKDSYPRLKQAIEINADAALQSASWGRYQTLGSHFHMLGYTEVRSMVLSFMDDEEAHLDAFVTFIYANGIDDDLRAGDYDTFFRAYNGPLYKKHGYDRKFRAALTKWKKVPDLVLTEDLRTDVAINDTTTVRRVQKELHQLGYTEVGQIDGAIGSRTRGAILAFRADHFLPLIPILDNDMLAALVKAAPRPISKARSEATVSELKRKGSRTVDSAQKTSNAAAVVAGGGAVTGVLSQVNGLADGLDSANSAFARLEPYFAGLKDVVPWIIAGLGAYIVLKQLGILKFRLEDYRAGKNTSEGADAR